MVGVFLYDESLSLTCASYDVPINLRFLIKDNWSSNNRLIKFIIIANDKVTIVRQPKINTYTEM